MKSRRMSWVVLLPSLFLIASCSSSANELLHSNSRLAADNTKVQLSITDSWMTTSTSAIDVVHRELINRFIHENQHVELNEDILDNASLKIKIRTLAAANVLPDIFMMLGSDAKMFLQEDRIMPVNQMLEEDFHWQSGFRRESFEDFMIDGQLAGIPMQMTGTSLIFYNKDIFGQAGYNSFPETWDQFIDAIIKIKELGYTPISLGNKNQWVAGSCLLSVLADRFTGTEWFNRIQNFEGASFNDELFVRALSAIEQLMEIGAFSEDINAMDNVQQRRLYYQEEAAMFLEGGWAVSAVTADAPKAILERTRLAVMPTVEGGLGIPGAISGGAGWAIAFNKQLSGVKLEVAKRLVKLLTGEAAANMLAELGDLSGSYTREYDSSQSSSLFEQYKNLMEHAVMTPVYDVRLTPEVIQVLNKGLQELLTPGSSLTAVQLAERIQLSYEQVEY